MTILNESGVPDVLSPLCGVAGLAEKLSDALLVVVGTRTEAYLAQSVPRVLSARSPARRDPRFLSLLLEEAPEEGRISSRLVEAAAGVRGIGTVLLVAGRSARLLGVDAGFEARLAARRLGLPVVVVDPDAGDSGVLSTDLEDRALAALVGLCPVSSPEPAKPVPQAKPPAKERGGLLGGLFGQGLGRNRGETRAVRPRPVVLLGTQAAGSEHGLAAELGRAGVEVAGDVPGPGPVTEGLPGVGEGTIVAVTDPYLGAASRAAEERGAEVVRTLMPIGVDGTARFIQDVAAAAGTDASELDRARSVWKILEPLRNRVRGKRIFFAGDTGLEISLARFLTDAGAVVLEVGAPRLERHFLAAEIRALGAGVDVVELPDPRGQMERIDALRPDVVVASPGLYVPLVARGHLCRSSLDFLGVGIHGYEGARRVLELFVRTFERAEALDAVKL